MAFTLDTTLGTLLDHPVAKSVIEKYMPGVANDPMVSMVRGMSVNMLLAMPQAQQMGLTREKAETVLAEINKRVG